MLSLVPVAVVTYLATWAGWFLSDNGYGRHWADGRGGTWSWIPASLRSLWHYEYGVYVVPGVGRDHPRSGPRPSPPRSSKPTSRGNRPASDRHLLDG